jgi:hypothetical protein
MIRHIAIKSTAYYNCKYLTEEAKKNFLKAK